MRRLLRNIDRELLKKAFLELPKRWLKCVKNGGNYFEGRHIDVETKYADLDIAETSEEEDSDDSDEPLDAPGDSDTNSDSD